MDDQSYILMRLAAGAVCLLLALIPAFIGKKKGYRFSTYYVFGAVSFLLALILALAVRPRKEPADEDIPSFRPGHATAILSMVAAALYTLSFFYVLIRSGLPQALLSGRDVTNMLFSLVIYKFPAVIAVWALGGGLLAAQRAKTQRRALVVTMTTLAVYATITIVDNIRISFTNFEDGIGFAYLMPLIVGLYVLILVFSLFSENRPVTIAASIAGIVCAALYSVLYVLLIVQHFNMRILLTLFANGTLLWSFIPIIAFASVLSGSSHKEPAYAAPGGMPQAPDRQPIAAPTPVAAPRPAAPEDSAPFAGAAQPSLPAMVVFAAESANAASMAMFGNTQQYYSPDYCISRVRKNFSLPDSARIEYVSRAAWKGPVPVLVGEQFQIDLPEIQRLQKDYLTGELGLSDSEATIAIGKAQAMQAPRLGLLWLCVPIQN